MNLLTEKDLQAIADLVGQSENRMKANTESVVNQSATRMKDYIGTSIGSAIGESENRMKDYIGTSIGPAIGESENRMKDYIESNVEKKIQLLAEGHNCILERLPDVDEQAQLKSRVRVLERVVTDMRVELDELKKA